MSLPLSKATTAVRQFFTRFNLYMASRVGEPPPLDVVNVRTALHIEEHAELLNAIERDDLVDIADALVDNVYACIGTMLVYGIPPERVFMEVHTTNMMKQLPLVDGKPTKDKAWKRPDIVQALLHAERDKQKDAS